VWLPPALPLAIVGPPVTAALVSFADANSNSGGIDITALIGSAITPAIVVTLLLFGKLHTEPEVRALREDLVQERKDHAETRTQLAQAQAGYIEKAIPALTRAVLVLETLTPILQTEVHLKRPTPPPGYDPTGG
jgi:hypothetical protein